MTASFVFDIDPFADPFEDAVAKPPETARREEAVHAVATPANESTVGGADLVALADALFDAGYRESAMALARRAETPEALACLHTWQQVMTADASLADRIARSGIPLMPSVHVADGRPRFVLVADAARWATALREEHGPTGILPELRGFLDEALAQGDVFVDAAPGFGFATLAAATSRAAVAVVVATDEDEAAGHVRQSACATGCANRVHFTEPAEWEAATLAQLGETGLVMLHAGDAGNVAPLLSAGRTALRHDRLGVVAWRCGTAAQEVEGTDVAAAVLGVLGFLHFAIAERDGVVELVPTDAVANNEYIFSVAPAFIARSEG